MASTTSYFCPMCMSPAVDFGIFEASGASCRTCKWSGRSDELTAYSFTPGQQDPEEVGMKFMLAIRDLISTIAPALGKLLIDYGFLDVKEAGSAALKLRVIRFVYSAARGMAKGLVEAKETLLREEHERANKKLS